MFVGLFGLVFAFWIQLLLEWRQNCKLDSVKNHLQVDSGRSTKKSRVGEICSGSDFIPSGHINREVKDQRSWQDCSINAQRKKRVCLQ